MSGNLTRTTCTANPPKSFSWFCPILMDSVLHSIAQWIEHVAMCTKSIKLHQLFLLDSGLCVAEPWMLCICYCTNSNNWVPLTALNWVDLGWFLAKMPLARVRVLMVVFPFRFLKTGLGLAPVQLFFVFNVALKLFGLAWFALVLLWYLCIYFFLWGGGPLTPSLRAYYIFSGRPCGIIFSENSETISSH